MSKKPNLAAAFKQAETDAALNADLLTRLQQQKSRSLEKSTPKQEIRHPQETAIHESTSHESEMIITEDQPTVSLSTRVPKSLRQQLKRISLDREELRQQPWGIQHIVTQAISEWLDKNK